MPRPSRTRVVFLLALLGAAPVRAADPPRPVWPVRDGVVARVGPSEKDAQAAGEPLKFLEPCTQIDARPGDAKGAGGGWAYLVRRSNPGVAVGWVPGDELLRTTTAEADPATGAPRMVVVSNTVLSLQSPGAEKLVEAPLLRAPRAGAARAGGAGIMDVYFRYKAANGHVLVGREPRFQPDAAGGTGGAIAGWVAEDLTVPFDGRLAVRWDRESTLTGAKPRRPAGGRLFRSRKDAYNALREPAPALFEEQADEDAVGLELPAAAARMPLRPLPDDDEFPEFDPRTNNQLLRVAGLGALLAANEKPPTRSEQGRIHEELQSLQSRLQAAKQILFVIDDTRSMEPQFRRVAKAVQTIVDDATKNPERRVEVAVSYYNDDAAHLGRGPGYQTRPLVDARSPAGRALLDEVNGHGERVVDGSDYPEMLAAGLEHALDDARFEAQPDASRLVVLIGDHGNRGEPDYDGLIDKLLGKTPDRIEFVTIQVVDPEKLPVYKPPDPESSKNARDAARLFKQQMETLVDRLNRKVDGPRKPGRHIELKDEGAQLTAVLDREYQAMKARERELEQTLVRLTARSFPTRVGPEMTGLLTARGVSLEQVQALVGVRVGQDGFVWRWSTPPVGDTPGVPLVRVEALLSRDEARALADRLEPLLTAKDPAAALRQAVGGNGSATFERAALVPLGLPSTSLLFRRPASTLTRELVATELPGALERLGKLRALADPARPSPRWFRLREGSLEWCWVDAETELP